VHALEAYRFTSSTPATQKENPKVGTVAMAPNSQSVVPRSNTVPSQSTLVGSIAEWLVDQALGSPDIVDMFAETCKRLYAVGVPVSRAMVTWPTLHPVVEIESATWRRGQKVSFEQIYHKAEMTENWLNSPFKYLLDTDSQVMRRHLAGPGKMLDFKVLESFAAQGFTDYLAMATEFDMPSTRDEHDPRGLLVSWTTDREGGFTDDDIWALRRVQRRFAVACKTVIQSRIARNIADTYLGKSASRRVLGGQIRRGDGETTRAVVLYSDLRRSTQLAETMPRDAFIAHLNNYFDCVAGAAIAAGGEVLDFIGDAVLAIFPLDNGLNPEADVKSSADCNEVVRNATAAVAEAMSRADIACMERQRTGLPNLEFGIALSIGEVMFGNIGVSERLTFSVIGPTVNEVARIEKLTKRVKRPVLATRDVVASAPEYWESVGHHDLAGLDQPVELFAWKKDRKSCPDELCAGRQAADKAVATA